MKNIACFDIGGTFIKYALINEFGKLRFKGKVPTPQIDAQNEIENIISEKTAEFQRNASVSGIGVSSCGLIDYEEGTILYAANIKGYSGMRIQEKIKKSTGLPVTVENDVRSACIGEMWQGSAKDDKDIVLLTIGTGIGSAIVINGEMIRGSAGLAGELGHMMIVQNGRECRCGQKGCFESYASTSALLRTYQEEAEKHHLIIADLSGEALMEQVQHQAPLATKVYNDFLSYLVTGLLNITYLLNPKMIIIGGGIASQGERFINEIRSLYEKRIMSIYQQKTALAAPMLQNNAGLYGVCKLALGKKD